MCNDRIFSRRHVLLCLWVLFLQVVGIPMETSCAPLLTDVFLYLCDRGLLDRLIGSGHRRLTSSFILCAST